MRITLPYSSLCCGSIRTQGQVGADTHRRLAWNWCTETRYPDLHTDYPTAHQLDGLCQNAPARWPVDHTHCSSAFLHPAPTVSETRVENVATVQSLWPETGDTMLQLPLSRLFTARASRQLLPLGRSLLGAWTCAFSLVSDQGPIGHEWTPASSSNTVARSPWNPLCAKLKETVRTSTIQSFGNERPPNMGAAHDPLRSWPECVVWSLLRPLLQPSSA